MKIEALQNEEIVERGERRRKRSRFCYSSRTSRESINIKKRERESYLVKC